jgi:ATP-binding cassette subfamily F protein uup
VAELVGEGREYINLNGRQKHVIAYLTDFLFSAKRARTRIAALSGGERNRVILAKLFTAGSNLLVLDEPTNDLDVETLEALESKLEDYPGTLIVVSHDRHFLDAVVTRTLVFEADGIVRAHVGGYSDWADKQLSLANEDRSASTPPVDAAPARTTASRKLSYKLKLELDGLPARIQKLETGIDKLQQEISAPDFYKQNHEQSKARLDALAGFQRELSASMDRWAELEERAAESRGV